MMGKMVVIENDGTVFIDGRIYDNVSEASVMRLIGLRYDTNPNRRGVANDFRGPTWFDWNGDKSWMKPEYR